MDWVARLFQDFATTYALLEQRKPARWAVFILLGLHSLLLGYSAYIHSPTLNEPAHLLAGLRNWRTGQAELYRVNPPFVRAVAALPVAIVGYRDDIAGTDSSPGARPVFSLGRAFVTANGDRTLWLITLARWACIPFSIMGAITCFLWARDLYGRAAGVLACGLWSLSPNILAHASLITPDAHSAALIVAASYVFWRLLVSPTFIKSVLAGLFLGAALLSKSTAILLWVLIPAIWVIYYAGMRPLPQAKIALRSATFIAVQLVTSLYVLNSGYNCDGTLRRLETYHFVSESLSGSPRIEHSEDEDMGDASPARRIDGNRFRGTLLAGLPVPLPQHFVHGIDIQQRDFEVYGRPSYLRGEFRNRGWWFYYLYAAAIKVPLGTWTLGLIVALLWALRGRAARSWRDEFVLLAPAIAIAVTVSCKTGFSEHMRYVLPAFPFAFIFVSQAVSLFDPSYLSFRHQSDGAALADSVDVPLYRFTTGDHQYRNNGIRSVIGTFIVISIAWSFSSSLWIYPHSISYFNELVGGPMGGPRHLLSSNFDWGQDLRYLRMWMDDHQIELRQQPLHLASYNAFYPADIGFADTVPWSGVGAHVVENESSIKALEIPPRSGYHAISANLLYGFGLPAGDGVAELIDFVPNDVRYRWCRASEPVAYAGYSITIYQPRAK